ncbi:DOMON domain-containing protein [Chryseobacterium salviniae]|uniref:T9SS type A sorting domain-containing protein n=1 Tax=Chryseobacterium salviniae TaxID=3101750 RepID=A0ABU6HY09_9FLAO|nr:T9SS type A sorting domain-containing protein [Chryseobacterium sp. T9W2-O]MEC3877723.1 T9SS type A sorting domain-containing protein [Chryseobacterium sp. T9W2-O]
MKKILLTLSMALASSLGAQFFSTGTVNLPTASMTVKIVTNPTTVTLTLTGDSNSMLAIGFGNNGMASGTDGFIYNSSANRDYGFNGIGVTPSADGSQDWTVTSNTVSGSTRTIIATRSLTGGSGDFVISNDNTSIDIFYARRAGNLAIGNHGALRDYATLTRTSVLATDEVTAENKNIILYPNPAKETVSIKNGEKIRSVNIFEATGRKIKTMKLDGKEINISDLKSGNYYFEMTLKDGSTVFEQLIKE